MINGMVTDAPLLRDEMFENANLHNPNGAWQMIFGVNTIPGYRRQGLAERVLRQVIADAGYGQYFGHGYGHSLGIQIHEAPNCNPSGKTPLPVGAICSAEPGIYLPGEFGVRIEDVVIVTADGCKNITKSPKELIIL